jgi:integrase/recombinase XerD
MKAPKDLGYYVRRFLGEHLPRARNVSPLTVLAYRDGLKLLLIFAAAAHRRAVAELDFSHLGRQTILEFLESLETLRSNKPITRNNRLAAIRSFFRFVSSDCPELLEQCAQILGIPKKKGDSPSVGYLTVDEVNAILGSIRRARRHGLRDEALLRFMYNTGARVQEALDVRVSDLQLATPAHVVLHGKGRKQRVCPLWDETVRRLNELLERDGVDTGSDVFVFRNHRGDPLTRFGVRYILSKYARAAAENRPTLARKDIHPHTLRHTTAMHLLQSGVDINTIRCWLGHASVATTNRYVEIDLEMKRKALEGLSPADAGKQPGSQDAKLLSWLESL